MISWEDFNKYELPDYLFSNKKKTDIVCPKCGAPVYMRTDIVLTSYPAQYQYECEKCNWIGYSYRGESFI